MNGFPHKVVIDIVLFEALEGRFKELRVGIHCEDVNGRKRLLFRIGF